MNVKTFSKKEAIKRGIEMTKKYFGVILIIMVIYGAIEFVQGQIQNRAGAGYVTKSTIQLKLYKSSAAADSFSKYLKNEGYINILGKAQDRLDNLASASDLNLPPTLEGDREKIFNFLQDYRYRLPFPKTIYYILQLAFWVLGMLMTIGLVKISLMLSRDESPNPSELFSNASFLVTYILSIICFTLAVVGGLVLLIIPGFIFMIALGMNTYFIVDQNMGPVESLSASRELTKGIRWQLCGFYGLLILFNIGGALCLLVGLLLTIPASSIASAYVYDRLRQQNQTASPVVN